jgi:Na+-transporting NADH:ubiquinone oxidoreductase subunit NqrB
MVRAMRQAVIIIPDARDPRLFQVLALGSLLVAGLLILDFEQELLIVAPALFTCLATQWACQSIARQPGFDLLSPTITALSLAILLRVEHPGWMVLAAFVAIAAKFIVRIDGRHVFNPANLGICVMLMLGQGWISPSQWGHEALSAFLFAGLAGHVLSRSKRTDIALIFLATFAAVLFLRAVYLGDPFTIAMQQLQSGALLLFALFMITDPKTTPVWRPARTLYAALVACAAAYLQFAHYMPDGLMFALFLSAPLVPLMNRLSPVAGAAIYDWSKPTA